MRGTCAILCACVPSGCFLPSRADLPSLARLPLVSRGVFIAGDYHSQGPDRINGEETMTAAESADLAQRYDPRDVQEKWQARWAELEPFRASEDPADPRERFYLVDMFPYPSGDLHMGHAEAYAIGDALARYHFLRGENVLHPIGWDAFGLPAENAAIRNNSHPADWTYANIETQAASFRRYATSFDWTRRLQTCDPAYYHWNQWLFLRFYERGLAYRRDGYVNWCPVDQTVLANEQVIAGKCERCGADVVRRMLNQWYFKITEYADRLLADAEQLEGCWPDRVLLMQRNWIGRSEGAEVRFTVEGRDEPVTVFTTRPDTLYGATFFVVAADSPLAEQICAPDRLPELRAYVEQVSEADRHRAAVHRTREDRSLPGPVRDQPGERRADPGLGRRLRAVRLRHRRDHGGARARPARPRLRPRLRTAGPGGGGHRRGRTRPRPAIATPGEGALVNSGPLDGLAKAEAIAAIIAILEEQGPGSGAVNLPAAGLAGVPAALLGHPDPDHPLPVLRRGAGARTISCRSRLPDLRGQDLVPRGVSPLAAAEDWVNVGLPGLRRPGQAGHGHDGHLRGLLLVHSCGTARPATPKARSTRPRCAAWAPVDKYVGGVEHAILHLLYSRFFTKVLYDMGMVDFTEPFTRLINQGQVINQGKAMSKSLGNGVDLGEQIERFGVDAIRLTMIFASPPEDDIDWADMLPAAMVKFLGRVWRIAADVAEADQGTAEQAAATGDTELRRVTHRTIDEVTRQVEAYHLNVAVARLMELVSATRKAIDSGPGAADPAVREAAEVLAVLVSLFAPYTAEEAWELLGHKPSVASASWPVADQALLTQEKVTCVVQVNGKVRDRLEVSPQIGEDELRELALVAPGYVRALGDQQVSRKVIVRAPKLVSIVAA